MADEISAAADENLAIRYEMEQLTFRQDGKSLGYCRRKLGDWSDPSVKAAVILLLHGAGERGDNNWSQLLWGAGPIIAYCGKAGIKALFLAPQCPAGRQWVDTPWDLTEHTMPAESESMKLAMAMLDAELAAPEIDRDRVFITGISMGGYGTWDAISRHPEKFAAAFPVCGGVDVRQVEKFKHMPILIYHGDSDTTVPTVRSRSAAAALREAGARDFRYVEVPNTGHDSWLAAYGNEANIAWLFAQKRK